VLLLLARLAAVSSGCRDAVADRLASLSVMTTAPDRAEMLGRESGSEIGGWPTTDDGSVRLSAFIPLASHLLVVTVTSAS